jgi:hypothetical protein
MAIPPDEVSKQAGELFSAPVPYSREAPPPANPEEIELKTFANFTVRETQPEPVRSTQVPPPPPDAAPPQRRETPPLYRAAPYHRLLSAPEPDVIGTFFGFPWMIT